MNLISHLTSEYEYDRFVVESSKRLQEDPTHLSEAVLTTMSQTLNSMANGLKHTLDNNPPAFKRPHTLVVVNSLWLLALSLSVTVLNFVAMLAKEWYFKFMCNRSGSPIAQVR
jgi:chemotaxis protein CheY-P-specific phosphatase CheC